MKKLALAVALLCAAPALAYPKAVGQLVSSGSAVNNTTTATPFTMPTGGGVWSAQCNGAGYVQVGNGASYLVTATTGVYLSQWGWGDWTVGTGSNAISLLPVSGAVTCTVFYDVH